MKPEEIVTASVTAANCLSMIVKVETTFGAKPQYRSLEQIALIVDLINTAVETMQGGEEKQFTNDDHIELFSHADREKFEKVLEKFFGGLK